MTRKPHELSEEFPEHDRLTRQLRADDPHFARLCDDYDAINHDIHLAETKQHPVEELTELQMRKQRLALKDEIWHLLKAAQSAG